MLKRPRRVQIVLKLLTCSTTYYCPYKSSSPSAHILVIIRHPMKHNKMQPHDYVHKTPSQNSPEDLERKEPTSKPGSVYCYSPTMAREEGGYGTSIYHRELLLHKIMTYLLSMYLAKAPEDLGRFPHHGGGVYIYIYAIVNLSN